MASNLRCGAARTAITPPEELLRNLHGLGGRSFATIIDELYLRAIAIESGGQRALLLSAELDKVPWTETHVRQLSQLTGIPDENILLFSTHCHTAPVTGIRPNEPPNDITKKPPEVRAAAAAYEEIITGKLFRTAQEAVQALKPAKITYTVGKCFLNVNRLREYTSLHGSKRIGLGINPEGPVDRDLFVMRIESAEGAPMAFFLNYAMHNVAMIGNNADGAGGLGCSSDISGTLCRHMEARFPGSTCLWCSGAAGDLNPFICRELISPDPVTGDYMVHPSPGLETSLTLRNYLAAYEYDAVLTALGGSMTSDADMVVRGTSWLVHTPGMTRDGKEVNYDIPIQALRIGSVLLLGIGGELFTTLGQAVKAALPDVTTVIINHEKSLGSQAGYILDDATIECCRAADWNTNVPGTKNHTIQAGYVKPALIRAAQEIYQKLFTSQEKRLGRL